MAVKEQLTLPPGPNGPVGSGSGNDLSSHLWSAAARTTPGVVVHPLKAHGCVAVHNWDVEELAHMVSEGR